MLDSNSFLTRSKKTSSNLIIYDVRMAKLEESGLNNITREMVLRNFVIKTWDFDGGEEDFNAYISSIGYQLDKNNGVLNGW